MADIPKWQLDGDWFDVCKCDIPCPCEFARTPTYGDCEGILVWHVRKGTYGDVALDGLSVIALGLLQGQHLGGRQGDDGHLHRRKRRRSAAGCAADDLRRPGRRLAGSVCPEHRRNQGRRVRPRSSSNWPATWRRGEPRFPARSKRRPRRWAVPRRRRASACRRSIPRDPRSDRAESRPGARRPSIAPTRSASSGTAAGSRASTFRSHGAAPADRGYARGHDAERRYAARGVRPPLLAHQPARGRRAGGAVGGRVAQHDRAGERDERHGDGTRPHRQPVPGHDERRRAAHDVGDDDGGDDAAHRRTDGARASRRHAPAGRAAFSRPSRSSAAISWSGR